MKNESGDIAKHGQVRSGRRQATRGQTDKESPFEIEEGERGDEEEEEEKGSQRERNHEEERQGEGRK